MSSQLSPLFPPQPVERHFSREADHRIANSLAMIGSLVRLRARKGSACNPRTFLTEIADRIDIVAKLHRLLANSASEAVMLDEYLKEICDLAGSVADPKPLILRTCPTGLPLVTKVVMPLGLITAELLSNSLKYAHPAGLPVKISLSCHRTEADGIVLVYEDDGVGFPEGFDPAIDGQMGFKLIEALTRQLNAPYGWSSDSLGVRFEMTVTAHANES